MTIRSISLFLLAAWLGAAVFFSAVVAPSAFSVLRSYQVSNSSEIAGAIVSRSLAVTNISGFLIALLVLLLTVLIRSRFERWSFILLVISLATVAIMCGVGQWVIAARMRVLRATLELPIDQIALSDPARVAFSALHHYSVMALSVALIGALIGSILLVRSGPNN